MNTLDAADPDGLSAHSAPGARHLARGLTGAWWYTVGGVIFLELMLVLIVVGAVFTAGESTAVVLTALIGGLLWFGSTLPLLIRYRLYGETAADGQWMRVLVPLAVAVAFGATLGVLSESLLLGVFPLAQSVTLLHWPRGVRARVVIGLVVALIALWIIDARMGSAVLHTGPAAGLTAFYCTVLPVMTVTTLWWWDVLSALNQARISESRLAATQERLRVATDVHDLQGHHLQVIALQLELAERLMSREPDAALEQLRAARVSVDEARQGTRDLALRFRSVPLPDEIANASDLLRAAGLDVTTTIAPDAADAPGADLGPVIRETTTNILRHGGGRNARLSLMRADAIWRYEIANDVVPGVVADADGSGLEGIGRRVREAGGTLEVRRGDEEFAVIVTVPGHAAASALPPSVSKEAS